MSRPRVFLSAYSCDPDRGSELTVGWNRALQAARHADVWMVTEGRGQQARVEAELAARGLTGRVHVEFLAHDAVERRAMAVPGLFYWAYRRWQRRALARVEALHARVGFDLLHHVNMVGFREPGYLGRLAARENVPLVLGPVGGTQNLPAAFLWGAGVGNGLKEAARTLANRVQLRLSGRFHAAARQAACVLAANTTGARDLARVGIRAQHLLETGAPPAGPARTFASRHPGPLRVLWAGEFSTRKGLHLMLAAHAALRAQGVDAHLTVAGDGPLRRLLPAGDPSVTWTGWLPRDQTAALYGEADVFVFTSLRDTSGNVVLEALAAGLPVVYLDHQGVHDMCAPDPGQPAAGVAVAVGSPRQAVADLAAAVRTLASDPALYDRLSEGATARARALSWDANGRAMEAIYASVLSRSGPPAGRRAGERLGTGAARLPADPVGA